MYNFVQFWILYNDIFYDEKRRNLCNFFVKLHKNECGRIFEVTDHGFEVDI